MEKEMLDKLNTPLPDWAVKPHPTKKNMTSIHPMAVIDRLNEVFGVGKWKFLAREIEVTKEKQQTRNGERDVWVSAVHGTLTVPKHDIHVEQFGGNLSDDKGDSLKGGATDALTKCGASIYKGQGNVEPPKEMSLEDALGHVSKATSEEELTKLWRELPANLQKDNEVVAKCKEIKKTLTN
jgi:hypothetical protein